MAQEKGFIADLTPGSVDEKAQNPGTFPTEAFEFTEPGAATPTLTLKSGWKFVVAGSLDIGTDLDVAGNAVVDGTTNLKGAVDVDAALNVDSTIHADGAIDTDAGLVADTTVKKSTSDEIVFWHKVANPTAGSYFASKTSGITADRFTADTGGLLVDFSTVVSVGTKAVMCYVENVNDPSEKIWTRPAGDDTYASNTPSASGEHHACIYNGPAGSNSGGTVAIIQLNANYQAEFAMASASIDIYVSYPFMELR